MPDLFEPTKVYLTKHLKAVGLVRDTCDLKYKIEKFGFPRGRLVTPRMRAWTGSELNDFFNSRPRTQAEYAKLPDRAPPSKPNIPKKAKSPATAAAPSGAV
jgi:hypothetical protein